MAGLDGLMTVAGSPRTGVESGRVPLAAIVAAIAATVGQQAGDLAIAECAREVGVAGSECSAAQALEILAALATRSGLLGVAGRFALQKWRAKAAQSEQASGSSLALPNRPAVSPDPAPTAGSPGRLGKAELAAMLAPALGDEKSRLAVDSAVQALGLGSMLDRSQALLVLEKLASEPGIVGVAARFTRARLLLR